jgi:serine/threonine protein phosphatase 1
MIYVVGDIHGKLDPLLKLVKLIKAHAATVIEDHTVVFVGDYIDRGGNEKDVINYLVGEPLSGFKHIFLRGNHEVMAIQAFRTRKMQDIEMWEINGGNTTMREYDLRPWQVRSGKTAPDLLDFIRKTEIHRQFGKFYLVHAGINPYCPLAYVTTDDKMWIRHKFLNFAYPFENNIVVIHGHTPVDYDPQNKNGVNDKPIQLSNRINIDTGAVWTGVLTAAVIDNDGTQLLDMVMT